TGEVRDQARGIRHGALFWPLRSRWPGPPAKDAWDSDHAFRLLPPGSPAARRSPGRALPVEGARPAKAAEEAVEYGLPQCAEFRWCRIFPAARPPGVLLPPGCSLWDGAVHLGLAYRSVPPDRASGVLANPVRQGGFRQG